MRVYVVGSEPRDADQAHRDGFRLACVEIGRELARAHLSLVISTDHEATADCHIISGIKQELGKNGSLREHKIAVTLLLKENRGEAEFVSDSPGCFLPKDRFVVTFIPAHRNNYSGLIEGLRHSDVTLLIGGGSGTITTGIAAAAMKQPTLALPQFGGAAEQTWAIFSLHYVKRSLRTDEVDNLRSRWNSDSAAMVVDALRKIRKHNPFKDGVEQEQGVLLAIAFVSLIGWICLFTLIQGPKIASWEVYTCFFALSGLGAALGSATRSIIKCYYELQQKFSLSEFITEFMLGIIMAFVLFLTLQLGGIVVSGTTMELQAISDPARSARLSTVMSLVSFATAFLIESSLQRLRTRMGSILDEAGGGGASSD